MLETLLKILKSRPFRSVVAGAVLTALMLACVAFFVDRKSYAYVVLLERTWLQWATIFVFWVSIWSLSYLNWDYLREVEAVNQAEGILEQFKTMLLWSDSDRVLEQFRDPSRKAFHGSLIFSRITNGLARMKRQQSTTTLDEYFTTRSDIDSSELDSNYAGVRFFVWVMPTIGLLGTVYGIGMGFLGFSNVIAKATDFKEMKNAMPDVTKHLGTAFDATLLALLASTIAVLYMSFLLKKQEHLAQRIDHISQDNVSSLFAEHSRDITMLVETQNENHRDLKRNLDGNRGAVVTYLREELPAQLTSLIDQGLEKRHKQLLQRVEEMKTVLVGKLPAMPPGKPSAPTPDPVLAELRQLCADLNRLIELLAFQHRNARQGRTEPQLSAPEDNGDMEGMQSPGGPNPAWTDRQNSAPSEAGLNP
jgi:biopolymer transport protein ExbB/TolQ